MNGLCDLCGAPATTGNFCQMCEGKLRTEIRHTPDLLEDLDVTTTKQAQQTPPGGGGGSTEQPLIFNVSASECATELTAALRGLAWAGNKGRRVYSIAVRDLALEAVRNIENVARSPRAGELATRLFDAAKQGGRLIDIAPERKVIGSCYCGQILATIRTEGWHECRFCGATWDIETSMRGRVDDALDYLATPAQAAGLISSSYGVKLKPNTVERWIERGHLSPATPGTYKVKVRDVIAAWEKKHGSLPGKEAA